MHMILKTWHLSLTLLSPIKFFSFMQSSLRVFARSLLQFITYFGWLICIDALFVLTIGDILAKALAQATSGKPFDGPLAIIMLVQSVIWFLASSAFFLLIRKDDTTDPRRYFTIYFFRYVQILLSASCLFLLCIYFCLSTGITKFPNAPWILLMVAKTAELYIIFYWLDAKGYFTDIFRSCEKALNFLFYNAPVISVFLAILWASNYGMCLLAGFLTETSPSNILFFHTSLYPTTETPTLGLLVKILAIKYLAFFIEHFWLCIIFVFYRRKKHEQYTISIFERS